LAEVLFNDEKALIRIDMSEYSESHSLARLIGSPPGYVGYDEGGQLTESVRRKPYSVILFDEIEKAHPLIFNLFLQIFDDGRLTDGKGRTVDFKNTILIMTSNLGGEIIRKHAGDSEKIQNELWEVINSTFKPEFINRIDKMIVFEPLTEKQIEKIVDLQLEKLAQRLEKQQIKVDFSDELKVYLAKTGYDTVFGARPIKRLIQAEIEDELALLIIEGKIEAEKIVKVGVKDGKVDIKVKDK
jgi:ATP-dependent Clp protease ATP-binding subunit ClpA